MPLISDDLDQKMIHQGDLASNFTFQRTKYKISSIIQNRTFCKQIVLLIRGKSTRLVWLIQWSYKVASILQYTMPWSS